MFSALNFLVFAVVVYYFGMFDWKVRTATILTLLGVFFVQNIYQLAGVVVAGRPLAGVASVAEIITLLLQLPVLAYTFWLMRRHEGSIAAWFGIAFVGALVYLLLVPPLASVLVR